MYPFQLKTEINRRIDEEQKMKNPDKQQSNKPKLNEYGFGRGTFLPVIGKNRYIIFKGLFSVTNQMDFFQNIC